MALNLPPGWWHQVLDGYAYEVNLNQAPQFKSLSLLRAAAYREAEIRGVRVFTHKADVVSLVIQAASNGQERINAVGARSAPPVTRAEYEQGRQPCNCTKGPIYHPGYCASWRVYPEPGPLWPKAPSAYEQGLVAACTCGLGNDVSTGHPPTCAVWG
jgi:hypothetical protein